MATRTVTEVVDVRDSVTGEWVETKVTREQKIVVGVHCQSCGRTDGESLDGDQGYSACCNEIVVIDCTPRVCYHD
jgi:hypothetical protein